MFCVSNFNCCRIKSHNTTTIIGNTNPLLRKIPTEPFTIKARRRAISPDQTKRNQATSTTSHKHIHTTIQLTHSCKLPSFEVDITLPITPLSINSQLPPQPTVNNRRQLAQRKRNRFIKCIRKVNIINTLEFLPRFNRRKTCCAA